jgi:hypothetical protein
MRTLPIPDTIALTIQSIKDGEGFEVYQSSVAGTLGHFVTQSSLHNENFIDTIVIPISPRYPFVSVTATSSAAGATSDVLISAVTIPHPEAAEMPMLLVVDVSVTNTDSVVGNFDGQLAIFKGVEPLQLRYWDEPTKKWLP